MSLTLVLGGARSGKSAWAQREAEVLAERHASKLVAVVTAQAFDEEMAERIARHRADRDARWRTLEAPLQLAQALTELGADEVAVVDCLTLWLSNVMAAERPVAAACTELVEAARASPATLILVSNEVGLGIVPDNALARRFRDDAGRLHQALATVSDRAVFVAAGLALTLKG